MRGAALAVLITGDRQRVCGRAPARGHRRHRFAHRTRGFQFAQPDRHRARGSVRADGRNLDRPYARCVSPVRAGGRCHVERAVERRPGQRVAARPRHQPDAGAARWTAADAGRWQWVRGPEHPPAVVDPQRAGPHGWCLRRLRLGRSRRGGQCPVRRCLRRRGVRGQRDDDRPGRRRGIFCRPHRRHVVCGRPRRDRRSCGVRQAHGDRTVGPAVFAVPARLRSRRHGRPRTRRRIPRVRLGHHGGRSQHRVLQPAGVRQRVCILRVPTRLGTVPGRNRGQRRWHLVHDRQRRRRQRGELPRRTRSGHVQRPELQRLQLRSGHRAAAAARAFVGVPARHVRADRCRRRVPAGALRGLFRRAAARIGGRRHRTDPGDEPVHPGRPCHAARVTIGAVGAVPVLAPRQ